MKKLLYLLFLLGAFTQAQGQNNTVYGAGISYTNGAPSFVPPSRTSRVAIDTITGKWYHFNTPGGWQLLGNTIEEIAGCSAPAYTPTKGDSKVVINNCTKPELYYWTGSVWVWINQGTTYTAGAGIRIESNSIILDSLYILRFRTGSNTDGAAGTMSWNATEETVDLVTDQGAVTGHLMESAYYNTRNTTGTPITIGRAVMAAGTTGNTGRILIAPAIADGTVNSEYILGITAETIGNNANGKVQHFGKIRGIQTNGANFGETWVDGDVLFCSAATPGYLTKVQPAAPNLKVPIAIVIHAHPSNGTLFIRPSHFPDLNQINDIQLTSPTTGQTLIYNSVTGVWSNQTPADPSSTNELQTLSTGTNTLTLSNGGGTVTVDTDPGSDIIGNGVAGWMPQYTGTTTIDTTGVFWSSVAGKLGVNTNTPNEALSVKYDLGVNQAAGYNFALASFTRSTGNGSGVELGYSTRGASTPSTEYGGYLKSTFTRLLIGTQNSWGLTLNDNGAVQIGGNIAATAVPTANTISLFGQVTLNSLFSASTTLGNPYIALTNDITGTGNGDLLLAARPSLLGKAVGINVPDNVIANSPTYIATFRKVGVAIGLNTAIPSARLHVVGAGSTSSTWTAQFHNSNGNNNALMVRDDGNIGIGTNAPSTPLHVRGTGGGPSGRTWIRVENTGTNSGSGFQLQNANGRTAVMQYTGSAYATGESFSIGTSSDYPVNFGTNGDGLSGGSAAITFSPGGYDPSNEVMRILPSKQIAINTTTPNASAVLDITSTTRGVLFPRMTTAQRNLITTPADGLVIYNTTDNKLQVRAAGAWVDLH